MTKIDVCVRCKRRLVIVRSGLCYSCAVYNRGQVTPAKWKHKSVPA
jgi:hypothetical protein